LYKEGTYTQREIGEMFGVTATSVWRWVND